MTGSGQSVTRAADVERLVLVELSMSPCTIHWLRAHIGGALEEEIREALQALLEQGLIEHSRAGTRIMEGCWQITAAGRSEA